MLLNEGRNLIVSQMTAQRKREGREDIGLVWVIYILMSDVVLLADAD
jgi:hypothetical protein